MFFFVIKFMMNILYTLKLDEYNIYSDFLLVYFNLFVSSSCFGI